MSVSEHISTVISSCAKSIYAHIMPYIRSHGNGMNNEALHMIWKSVIIAKLLYAASAWWGFTTATDRQRLEALM